MELRNYQIDTIKTLKAAFEEDCRGVMCQMPTGTGKTVVLSYMIQEAVREGNVLVVAHRKEILSQIKEMLRKFGLAKLMANGRIVVESIQRMRTQKMENLCPILVVVDEAHHAQACTYKMLWDRFPGARFLGMTATPCRMKKEGFADLFDKLVCTWDVNRFIMEGWLADYDYIAIRPDSEIKERLELLKKRGLDGDYQVKEMGSVMDNRACIEQLYRSYKHFANGRQGIIYAINREHAEHIRLYYEEQGESIMLVDSKTPKGEREHLMEEYRQGKIRIFVNCEIAGEGVDVPNVSFIQMARPTLSLSKYLQQVGRGLRPNKYKEKTVILDNVGMYYLFGLPNEERDWRTMFRAGQETPNNLAQVAIEKEAKTLCYEEGHALDMVPVKQTVQKTKAVIRKKYVMRRQEYVLVKSERTIADNMFISSTGFIDGVVQLGSANDGMFYFYDADGRLLYKTKEVCSLMKDQFLKVKDNKGNFLFRDLRTGLWHSSLPSLFHTGNATFYCGKDGWHLRSKDYHCIQVDREHIKEDGSGTFIQDDQNKVKYLVLGANRLVLQLLGVEEDGSHIFADNMENRRLFARKNGKLTIYTRNSQNEWLYRRWQKAIQR